MAFGGAGGLFATLLAGESEIPTIVIPPFSGNFSAWGLLGADITQTAAQTMIAPLSDESTKSAEQLLGELLDGLSARAGERGGENDAAPEAALDLRYEGQEYSLTVPVPLSADSFAADSGSVARSFEEEYEKIFGHRMQERIEIVAVRGTLRTAMRERVDAPTPNADGNAEANLVSAYSFAEDDRMDFPVVQRGDLAIGTALIGPALIAEETAMTYLDSGFRATVHPSSSLVIERGGGSHG
jgi:N-methylhydantoinase A